MMIKLKLINSHKKLNVECTVQPPLDGWRITESGGRRKVIRNIKVQNKWTTENLIRYVNPFHNKEYQESILKLNIIRINHKRMGANRYIYEVHDGFQVRVGKKYLGWFKKFSKAKKLRDTYIKETAQSIQQ